jgi:hypothetical protein
MGFIKFISINLIFFYALSSSASRYYVATVSGASSEEDIKVAVFELLTNGLKEQNQEIVTDSTQAEFIVETQVLKLGTAYLITVSKSREGKIILSKKMKASSAEEIDKATHRLARTLVTEVDPNKEIQIGEITQDETTKISRRTETLDFRTFSFGGASFENLKNSHKNMPSIYLGTGYQADVTEQSAIRLNGEVAWRQDPVWSSMWDLNIGYGYYFRNAQISPYVTFDFGYGGALCPGQDSISGMTLGAQLGLGMFRMAQKQMSLSLRYLHLYKDNGLGEPELLAFMINALL